MEKILALRICKDIVGIVGILGNALVCIVICKVSAMQTRTNAFIFHQAVVDFLGSTIIILQSETTLPDVLPDNILGWFICNVWSSGVLNFTIYVASTYNLLAVTMERYFAIVHPFKYQAAFSRHPRIKVGLVIATCWITAFSTESFIISFFKIENGQCLMSIPGSKTYGIVVVFTTYIAPAAVMLFAYIRTSADLRRGAARVGPSSGQAAGMAESLLKARRNTFKTLLIVFITFMVCWTPNELFYLLFNLGLASVLNSWYHLLSMAMVATNSCVNPVIYALKYRQFRKGLREVFGGKCGRPADVSHVGSLPQNISQTHP